MSVASYLILATLLPLAGFLVLIFLGRRLGGLAGPLATALVVGSLGLSIAALVMWVAKDSFNQPHYVEALTYRWLPLPEAVGAGNQMATVPDVTHATQGISVGYCVDSLTLAMFVMVTFIASLVHLFSIAHMAGDPRLPRYFAYLGLFCFGMLGMVLSNSLVQVFALWQVAAVASYLLIGFWYERRGPATSSLKMWVVHAIGDAAFLVGMGVLAMHVGRVSGMGGLTFYDAQGASPLVDSLTKTLGVTPTEFLYFTGASGGPFLGLHWLTWVGLLLFGGAAAKSAQFPLHVWLPEAMEAPMPAAALVHGSAFIAAGVYLVARIYPILTIDAHVAIAILGCITLLAGALMAMVQTNLKHILAYSTMSQVGYMMLFLGTGGYTAGLVHLFTHAFFNAGLLLAAASVMQAVGGVSDIRQMGGLWRKLPLTAVGFLLASLALIGVPFFSGSYSRGLGLAGVFDYAHVISTPKHARLAMVLFYVPAGVCFVTAFYTARCWWLIFAGKSRNEDLAETAHEPFLMVLPIGILALLSFNFYEVFFLPSLVVKSLAVGPPVIRTDHTLERAKEMLMLRPGGYAYWGFLGALPAILLYYRGLAFAERLRRLPLLNLLHVWLRERMFFDAIYNGVLLKVVLMVAGVMGFVERFVVDGLAGFAVFFMRAMGKLFGNIDRHFVDGAAGGVVALTRLGARGAVASGGGRVRIYILVMVSSVAVLGAVVVMMACWR